MLPTRRARLSGLARISLRTFGCIDMSPSRLWHLSQILQVRAPFFFNETRDAFKAAIAAALRSFGLGPPRAGS